MLKKYSNKISSQGNTSSQEENIVNNTFTPKQENQGNDILQLLPFNVVVVINFCKVFTNLSASPFASGCNGVIVQRLNLCDLAYSANSLLWQGGPLSDLHSPCIPAAAEVDPAISTTGHRE